MDDVVIVGGGLAGLACAVHLHERGLPVRVIEASPTVGGRLATERRGGFLLDRGFQVLLTAYPECRLLLSLESLDLGHFLPGALIRRGGRFRRLVDPRRRPAAALTSAFAGVGSVGDKLRVLRLARDVRQGEPAALFRGPAGPTHEALRQRGFSNDFVAAFLRPFLGGIFLEDELRTDRRWMAFVLRMFAEGTAALPADGMAAIPRQLAARLPDSCVVTGQPVARATAHGVTVVGGRQIPASAVVIATDGPAAARLLDRREPEGRDVTCLYYAAPQSPVDAPMLVLNGDGDGPVHHLCVPSDVQPTYAPPGQSLVSVTVLGDPPRSDLALEGEVRAQLQRWYPGQVKHWRHLETQRVRHALPERPLIQPDSSAEMTPDEEGRWICGDHTATASIQGALESGRRAAQAVARALRVGAE